MDGELAKQALDHSIKWKNIQDGAGEKNGLEAERRCYDRTNGEQSDNFH